MAGASPKLGLTKYLTKINDINRRKRLLAYHGTPHEVDKFSSANIGTGEGAQAYGHGLYFAENPDVAKEYQQNLARVGFEEKGEKIDTTAFGELQDRIRKAVKDAGGSTEDAMEAAERWVFIKNNPDKTDIPYSDVVKDTIKDVEKVKSSNLYKVELDIDPDTEMLDWDLPLSEMNQGGRDKLLKLSEKYPKLFDRDAQKILEGDIEGATHFGNLWGDMSGNQIHDKLSELNNRYSGTDFGDPINSPTSAANDLADIGIKGIRYDDGFSRGKEGGTKNFVVFDDSLITIAEKNGIPIQQVDELASSQGISRQQALAQLLYTGGAVGLGTALMGGSERAEAGGLGALSKVSKLQDAFKKANLNPNDITIDADGSIKYPEFTKDINGNDVNSINELSNIGAGDVRREVAIHNDAVEGGDFKSNFGTDVLHGSTHDIKNMDGSLANPESDWGRGTYSSVSVDDVNTNYAGEGADLTIRIENRAERLADDMYDADTRDEILKANNITLDEFNNDMDLAIKKIAKNELKGDAGEGVVYPLKKDTSNYAVLGGKDTSIIEPDETHYIDILESDYDNIDDFHDAVADAKYTGLQEQIYDALRDTDLYQNESAIDDVMEYLTDNIMEGEVSIYDLDKAIRENAQHIQDEFTGDFLSGGELSSQTLKNLGFDGVIDNTVNQKFGTGRQFGVGMEGVDSSTQHIVTFPSKENKIRSKYAAFDPQFKNSSNLLGQAYLNPITGLAGASVLGAGGYGAYEASKGGRSGKAQKKRAFSEKRRNRFISQASEEKRKGNDMMSEWYMTKVRKIDADNRGTLENLYGAAELGLSMATGYADDVLTGVKSIHEGYKDSKQGLWDFDHEAATNYINKPKPSIMYQPKSQAALDHAEALGGDVEEIMRYWNSGIGSQGNDPIANAMQGFIERNLPNQVGTFTRGMKPVDNFINYTDELGETNPFAASLLKASPEVL